jgi:hypothetical protein
VDGTGVGVRLATDAEAQAVAAAHHGREFVLTPSRSFVFREPDWPLRQDEALVVSQAFVEFVHDGREDRWVSYEHHGHAVSTSSDATMELLRLVDDTVEDLIDLLSDMRIAGLGLSRWELMSAPRRIELDPGLVERLAPLRRG